MTYTTHGHHIPNSPTNDENQDVPRYRCGGTLLCPVCRKDAGLWASVKNPTI